MSTPRKAVKSLHQRIFGAERRARPDAFEGTGAPAIGISAGQLTTTARSAAFASGLLLACAALVLLALLGLLRAPAPAEAAGSFPGQDFLPDHRGWEMVSPPHKNGGDVIVNSMTDAIADGGGAVQFGTATGFGEDQEGAPAYSQYTAVRGDDGWQTHAVSPPQESNATAETGLLLSPPIFLGLSADLDRGIYFATSPLTDAPSVAAVPNLYLQSNLLTSLGDSQLLTDCPACSAPLPRLLGATQRPVLASANAGTSQQPEMTHALFETPSVLTTDANGDSLPSGTSYPKLYLWDAQASDETQSITVSATDGQFTLSYEGQTTDPIDFDSTPGQVSSALEALSSFPAGASAKVSGGPGDAGGGTPYLITFGGSLAGQDVSDLSSDPSQLTGGSASGDVATVSGGGRHVRLAGVTPDGTAAKCNGSNACSAAGTGALNSGRITDFAADTLSSDGSKAFFTSPVGTDGNPSNSSDLYMRDSKGTATTADDATLKLNESERTTSDVAKAATYQDASSDGTKVFFVSAEALTDDAPADGAEKLYAYDTTKPASSSDNLTFVSGGMAPLSGNFKNDGGSTGVIGVSKHADYAYYVGRFGGTREIRAYHDDGSGPAEMRTVATLTGTEDSLSFSSRPGLKLTRISPDGTHLLFEVTTPLTGQPVGNNCVSQLNPSAGTQPCGQLFVYDATADGGTGELQCASCKPSGGVTNSYALLDSPSFGDLATGLSLITQRLNHALSDDGRFVFFATRDRLVPEDENDVYDVYEYDTQERRAHLLTSGSADTDTDSFFIDATPDGSSALISTREPLAGADSGKDRDLYVATVDGGFPGPEPEAPPCINTDSCHGPVSSPDQAGNPASIAHQGEGNLSSKPDCSKQERKLERARRKLQKAYGKHRRRKARKQVRQARKDLARCRKGQS